MAGKKVFVVVLGDVGRSPRMLYHALSLSQENFNVKLIGYSGSTLPNAVLQSRNISFVPVPHCPDFRNYLPVLVAYILKVIWQSLTLFYSLLYCGRPQHILTQNPPAIPTIPICWFYGLIMRSNFIIDWHNYAFSILSLSLGNQHKLVQISKQVESVFGRKSHANLCVTKAMEEDLLKNWNIRAHVLYDRPNEKFKPLSNEEKQAALKHLSSKYPCLSKLSDLLIPLIVSSTSWTPDEDFSTLLSALETYDETGPEVPHLLCAITGKGPDKEYYLQKISSYDWKKVSVVTPWLDAEDYPLLLGCANLGVCLHASSSGLDLPMKVVDMFGCGLPVCALKFKCLHELVKHEVNGFVFEDSSQLYQQLRNWFKNFPNFTEEQQLIQRNVLVFRQIMWHENWCSVAKPLFL